MGESYTHHELVRRTYRYISDRYPLHRGYVIFVDEPKTLRGEKPPRVGGFVPDVLAMDVPTTMYVIGEAKTAGDLDRAHTTAQLVAYLRHLRTRGGILVITIPWVVVPVARRITAAAVAATRATNVETVVLDDVEPCPW